MCRSITRNCRDKQDHSEIHKQSTFEAQLYLDFTNSRLKVKSYCGNDIKGLAAYLIDVAKEEELGKILFNIDEKGAPELEAAGYVLEGKYPGFFNGNTAWGYSFFVDDNRKESKYWEKEEDILQSILSRQRKESSGRKLDDNLYMRAAVAADAGPLARLYGEIFSTYPSPLLEQDYIKEVMQSHVLFAAIFRGDLPVSAASADMDAKNSNAEITDCATLTEYRGKGLLTYLIRFLEKEMEKRKIHCLYSLARAGSYGMNASLYNLGYNYSGRFVNNCHIGGRYEDMNLWVK
jgi:putative beta-lysine N-acetyltransferase